MKLVSLQIYPHSILGWGSDCLRFGEDITQLYGPNGCGKTPIIQSIVFCLGYPSVFRADIYEKCSSARLIIDIQGGEYTIDRIFSRNLDITVRDPDGEGHQFYEEKEYSAYLLKCLGYKSADLVSKDKKPIQPYLATLLPLFYLDQDEGYAGAYRPPANFIKDQFSEMIRGLFSLPPKNSYDKKKAKIQVKNNLDYLDRNENVLASQVEVAKAAIEGQSRSVDEINSEMEILEAQANELRTSSASQDDSLDAFDRIISNYKREILDVTFQISELAKRQNAVRQMVDEINSEIETLALNEEARKVFSSFGEICAAENCQLFAFSSDAYSKNLLYLKDQIKDLERNSERDIVKKDQMLARKIELEKLVASVSQEKEATLQKSDISSLVDAITELRGQIFKLQQQRSQLEHVDELEKRHFDAFSERNKVLELYKSFSAEGSTNPDLIQLKAKLRAVFIEWLDRLHIQNVSRDVTFKDDFEPVLGNEKISDLKGSTRLRAVLAYHAALIQLLAKLDGGGFRFLILDTPKQHEIHNADLEAYFGELKMLCREEGLQVIFSTTEYHYEGDEFDIEWLPLYPGAEQKMFLKEG